jgi:hypothetical protein
MRSEDCSPKSHLYKVLKRLESNSKLSEQDLNFMKNRKLTIAIANQKYATAAAYLLKKDSEQYAWAKAYLKKSKVRAGEFILKSAFPFVQIE